MSTTTGTKKTTTKKTSPTKATTSTAATTTSSVVKKPKAPIERLVVKDAANIHGHFGDTEWLAPRLAAKSNKGCRTDQDNNIPANEYLDEPDVLEEKMKRVAELIKKSKCCVAYTGAGLSKASGIPDYATKATNSVVSSAPKLTSSLDALPTYAHKVITAMEKRGYIHYYVQQNHDGLPQKSGFPQRKMNEIHGAWFDPSNPVVKFSGSLRTDLYDSMLEIEDKSDLCLCLGTSLSGMNADRMAKTPGTKMLKDPTSALGTIIINLQQTPLDYLCAVRVWAKIDDAFKILMRELGISEQEVLALPSNGYELKKTYKDQFPVPYDKNGKLVTDPERHMILDLTNGAKVRIAHPLASNYNIVGEVAGKRNGDYSISLKEKEGLKKRLMGKWWVEEALNGTIDQLPLVNVTPKFM